MTENENEPEVRGNIHTHLQLGGMVRDKVTQLLGVTTAITFHIDGTVSGCMEFSNNLGERQVEWIDSDRLLIMDPKPPQVSETPPATPDDEPLEATDSRTDIKTDIKTDEEN